MVLSNYNNPVCCDMMTYTFIHAECWHTHMNVEMLNYHLDYIKYFLRLKKKRREYLLVSGIEVYSDIPEGEHYILM